MQNQIDNNEIYNENEKERAFLISVDTGDFDALVSIKELEELADTAGAEVVGTSIQKRNAPVAATFVGKGALYEFARFCENMNVDLIIADSELSPVQIRNLEDLATVQDKDDKNYWNRVFKTTENVVQKSNGNNYMDTVINKQSGAATMYDIKPSSSPYKIGE